MVLRLASDPAYSKGRMRFVKFGENVTPASREMTWEPCQQKSSREGNRSRAPTGFGEIELFFEKV
jgi:hypothetical protein